MSAPGRRCKTICREWRLFLHAAVLQQALSVLLPCIGAASTEHCFVQQYSNRVANFGSLHVVRGVGVISPLGAFYLAHSVDDDDPVESAERGGPVRQRRNLVRRENGELLIIYSGHSARSLEWAQMDVLATALRLEPILGDDAGAYLTSAEPISPILLVNACLADGPEHPIALPAPFTLRHADQLQLGIVPNYNNELRINFRTFQNGLFFYSMADQGDQLVVQLAGGRAEVHFDFGAQRRTLLAGGLALDDGRWHELRWSHQHDIAYLFVDGVRANETEVVGKHRRLDLHSEVQIGGPPEEIVTDEDHIDGGQLLQPHLGGDLEALQPAFHGCLARMELNGVNLLASAPRALRTCQMPRPQLVALGPGAQLQIPYSFLPFAFDFHTLPASGPLLAVLDQANASLLQIGVEQAAEGGGAPLLRVHTALPGVQQAHKTIPLASHVRGWHSLAVKLRGESLDLELDGRTAFWLEGHLARRIGATMHAFLLSAMGCYRSATIDFDQGLPLGSGEVHRATCPLVEQCAPSPCLNGGRCLQHGFAAFTCECPRNYTGRYCHVSRLPHSCEEHFAAAPERRGIGGGGAVRAEKVLIDLDGGGPLRAFSVECRRRRHGAKKKKKTNAATDSTAAIAAAEGGAWAPEPPEVLTVLRHDGPPSGIVVRGVSEPGAVRRVLDYGVGESELHALLDDFDQCAQLMRFECSGGQQLLQYGAENRPSVWYAGRNGQHGLQWGDAPPFSRLCPCALNDSCVEAARNCNCDSGHDAVDVGVNPHLQLLPVLQLFIGGGPAPEATANVTIGALECSGRHVFETITFLDRNQRLVAIQHFPSAATFHASISMRVAHAQLTVFTYESANHERWFQLFVRGGRPVGQMVYAGISHELVANVSVDDNKWHTVRWEVDELSMRLTVDRVESAVFSASVPPLANHTLVVGSRTGKDRSGFAGQLRNFYLNGAPVPLGEMARRALDARGQRVLGAGVQLGEWGACGGAEEGASACRNGGKCVELYDALQCNCSQTPFAGDTCEEEVGMWVPRGSELKIAWLHPAQVANCFRISVQSPSRAVHLIRAHALFAEAHFNMSVDSQGHLNVFIYDGFFFTHNATFDALSMADNKTKDIHFCANASEFALTVNGERAIAFEGNFTFFSALNAWHFIERNFSGCIARLMVGDAFPLKSPRDSRLTHSGPIRFGSCPFDALEHRRSTAAALARKVASPSQTTGDASVLDIHASSHFVKSQRQLLFITPAIGLLSALCILLSLCVFLLYVQRRPEGVYKTNEKSGGGGTHSCQRQQQQQLLMGTAQPPLAQPDKFGTESISLSREYFC